jgi:hypothetical protein
MRLAPLGQTGNGLVFGCPDRPLDCNEGVKGYTVLGVNFDCSLDNLAVYEWVHAGWAVIPRMAYPSRNREQMCALAPGGEMSDPTGHCD